MHPGIMVACDGDWNEPEIQISGSQGGLVAIGRLLSELTENCEIESNVLDGGVYQVRIPIISVHMTPQEDSLLQVSADESSLKLSGDAGAIRKLGQSLVNFFSGDVEVGQHFQLDYYPGNQLLRETNCHLVFICDR